MPSCPQRGEGAAWLALPSQPLPSSSSPSPSLSCVPLLSFFSKFFLKSKFLGNLELVYAQGMEEVRGQKEGQRDRGLGASSRGFER